LFKHIGFYSHIPFSNKNNIYYAPSYIGKYLKEISKKSKLVVFGHLDNHNIKVHDYKLDSPNIRFINIGTKSHSLIRFFFGFYFFLKHCKDFSYLDHMVVRSPTPLSFWFRVFLKRKKLHYLLVADEKQGAINREINGYRDLIIKYFLFFSDFVLKKCVYRTKSFVNSKALFLKYKEYSNVKLVSTSNLEKNDYVSKLNFEFHSPIRVLYVGRLDLSKGILETLEAIKLLNFSGIKCHYNIVGWDEASGKNKKKIINKIDELNICNLVKLSGSVSHGDKLNEIYRNSDIYIIASYHEGFPRTILESMASSTIVIASSVGAIPIELQNNHDALLIKPKSVEDIFLAVKKVISNPTLRKKIITNGFHLSKKKNIVLGVNQLLKNL
jgi:glycosyltransferase involved in cell wall biosynthesis